VLQPPSAASFRALTTAERQASLEKTLRHWQPDQDVWVFGYGSLIWRPDFNFSERRQALLYGYHRALCLWSRVNRGTPERPGLVFALDAGGSCRGVAYKIAANDVPDTMQALWHREMPSGSYLPKWLQCRTPEGPIRALTFIMNRNTNAYVTGMGREQLIRVINSAHGRNGPCREYVVETAVALKEYGINDQQLQNIVQYLEQSDAQADRLG